MGNADIAAEMDAVAEDAADAAADAAAAGAAGGSSVSAGSGAGGAWVWAVQLHDFVAAEQLDDADERAAVVDDVHALLAPHLPPPPRHASEDGDSDGSAPDADAHVDVVFARVPAAAASEEEGATADVVATCPGPAACLALARALGGAVVGGDRLRASALCWPRATWTPSPPGTVVPPEAFPPPGTVTWEAGSARPEAVDGAQAGAVVAVRGYLSRDDLADLAGTTGAGPGKEGSDELAAAKEELLALARARLGGGDVFVRRVAVWDGIDGGGEGGSGGDGDPPGNTHLVACAGFNERAGAERAMLRLDGAVIGGVRVRAAVSLLAPPQPQPQPPSRPSLGAAP
jgi:hypothetical protein